MLVKESGQHAEEESQEEIRKSRQQLQACLNIYIYIVLVFYLSIFVYKYIIIYQQFRAFFLLDRGIIIQNTGTCPSE